MGRTPHVLYLGWWPDTADALARHGGETTFVVPAADAGEPARHGSAGRVVVVPDATRLDDVAAGLLRASVDVRGFDVVCSEHEECIVPAAVLAAAYDRPGLPVDTAVALRDKAVQKRRVRAAGVPAAGCRTVTSVSGLPDPAAPYVVKPLAGVSTQLTFVVRDRESLDRARAAIAASGQPGPWLVEEFVEGVELHVDGVVREGVPLFAGVSRYLQNVIEIQNGRMMGSVTVDPASGLYDRVREPVAAALTAIGHTDGVFHMELFDQGDRLVFSECAGRVGGGMIPETTRVKFGVDLYDEWARAVLGLPAGVAPDRGQAARPYGWVHLPARPGRVRSMPGLDELRRRPGVAAARLRVGPGDVVPDLRAASNIRAGTVMMSGESEESLAAEMRALTEWFRDRVRVEP
ncbi:MAG TPA: hypothetical protein VFV66_30745 [Nonomuraea sp.]|nr:hypothetical protein [Nonomuraea sp.]